MLNEAGIQMKDDEDLSTTNEKFLGKLVREKVWIRQAYLLSDDQLVLIKSFFQVRNRLLHLGQVPVVRETILHNARSKQWRKCERDLRNIGRLFLDCLIILVEILQLLRYFHPRRGDPLWSSAYPWARVADREGQASRHQHRHHQVLRWLLQIRLSTTRWRWYWLGESGHALLGPQQHSQDLDVPKRSKAFGAISRDMDSERAVFSKILSVRLKMNSLASSEWST